MDMEKVISGIHSVRERIHKQNMWDDPVSLSDAMTKLAVYNAYLADNIAPLHKTATDKQYAIFLEAKEQMSITQAEITAKGEATRQRHDYENILNIYRATDNLISVLQSRVRVAENQLKREGL